MTQRKWWNLKCTLGDYWPILLFQLGPFLTNVNLPNLWRKKAQEGLPKRDTLDRTSADSDSTKGTTGTTCMYKHCHYLEETWRQSLVSTSLQGRDKKLWLKCYRQKRNTARGLWEARSVRHADVVFLNITKDCSTWRCWGAGLKCSLSLRKQLVWHLIYLGGFQWRPELMSTWKKEGFVRVYKGRAWCKDRLGSVRSHLGSLQSMCVCIYDWGWGYDNPWRKDDAQASTNVTY